MRDIHKDQEQTELAALIKEKAWGEVDNHLKQLNLDYPVKLYNQAYIFYQQGKTVDALKLLEEAKFSGYFSENTVKAIQQIKEELGTLQIESDFSTLEKTLFEVKSMPSDFLPSIGSILLIVMLSCLIIKRYIIASFVTLIALGTIVLSVYISQFEVKYNLKDITVYKGPSKIFEAVQIVPAGMKLIFTKTDADWVFIEHPKDFQGWVFRPKVL